MTLDLTHIRSRAEAAEQWVRRQPCNTDGFLPLSFREHFEHDVPALIAEIERLRARITEADAQLEALMVDVEGRR